MAPGLRPALLALIVLQLATVALLAALVLRPQPSPPDVSGQNSTIDIQALDRDLQQSMSESCKAILNVLPSPAGGFGNYGPTCP